MKWIGLVAALALLLACFMPWIYIESKNITVTGIHSTGTTFGKPGYFHFVVGTAYLVFNFVPKVWAKRWNLLVVALNIAWAARNYLLISACAGGECPEKKVGLYLVLVSSVIMLAAALLPQIKMGQKE